MEIGLDLLAIAEDLEMVRRASQLVDEIIDRAVRRPIAHDVREARHPSLDAVIADEGGDECLRRELGGAIMRDRQERAVGLGDRADRLAIDGGRRCEDDLPDAVPAHPFQDGPRRPEGMIQIGRGIGVAASDVGIGRHVEHGVEIPGNHEAVQRRAVGRVHLDRFEPIVTGKALDVLGAPEQQVVDPRKPVSPVAEPQPHVATH